MGAIRSKEAPTKALMMRHTGLLEVDGGEEETGGGVRGREGYGGGEGGGQRDAPADGEQNRGLGRRRMGEGGRVGEFTYLQRKRREEK